MTFSYATTIIPQKGFSLQIKKIFKRLTLQTLRKSFGQLKIFISSHSIKSKAKRSFIYISFLSKGSITLEAAIAIPLFFLGLLSFISVINIIYLQTELQIALEETIRNVSKEAYISSEFYALSSDKQYETINKDSSIAENLGATLISVTYIKNKFLTEDIKEFLDNSFIKGGADGISFKFSSVDMNKSTLDIIIDYKCSIPFIPSKLLCFNLSNRCYTRIYMGQDMEKEQKDTYFYVYFAGTSSVIHTNKYCQYLLNYSKAIKYNNIIKQHPINSCALCSKNITIETLSDNNAIVYLTSNEDTYHVTLDCQSFTKDVFRLKVLDLKDKDVCEQCLKGK